MNKLRKISYLVIAVMIFSVIGFGSNAQAHYGPMVNVNIVFEDHVNTQFLNNINAEITHEFSSFPGVTVTMPASAMSSLDRNPNIASWEQDFEIQLLEDSIDWGVDRVDAERVWGGAENAVDVTTGVSGSGVKVAVIDTGIDYNHEDLSANYAGGYDFYNGDSNPMDDHGHGTHVAGTIAAADNEITGSLVGVAPNAQIYAVKVCSGSGSCPSSSIAAGIDWAANNGMDIASLSLGGGYSSTVDAAGQNAYAAGVLLVAASGNSGSSSVSYPAANEEFIAVGATNQNDNLASFSQYGSAQELVAPGVDIRSANPNNQYATWSGTSMATPHVSGVAALVKSADSSLTNTELRNILTSTAEDLGSSGWDSIFGYGLVDAEAAVAAAGGGGGGGGDAAFELRYESYDWDIAGEMDVFVNGVEVNWESYGLSGNNQQKTFTIDISDIVSDPTDFTVTFIDTYDNYNNDIRNVQLLVDGSVYQTWQTSWIEPDGSGLTYSTSGGGGGGDTIGLSIYVYDWDISGEVNLIVNGVELNWEAQGLTADGGFGTYSFDITDIAGSSLQITLIDTYGSYTNYFRDLIVYRNGNAESNLQSSWVETPGSPGVSYTYNL